MNADDFEKKLQSQRLRRIPDHWRTEILQAAQPEASPARQNEQVVLRVWLTVWRELLQPCRYAWLGMATLWLVFWMINSQMRSPDSRQMARSTSPSPERFRLFEEQRQALAELTGPNTFSPAEPARSRNPKPRSEAINGTRSC